MSDDGHDLLDGSTAEFVTVRIAGQLFGLPILAVEDVFSPNGVTQVPLSISEVAGLLNLRGRIVTAIDMRRRLRLKDRDGDTCMAIGIQHDGEFYGLIVDSVGEVVRLKQDGLEPTPINLNPNWTEVAAGIYQLERELMVLLDVPRVLNVGRKRGQVAA